MLRANNSHLINFLVFLLLSSLPKNAFSDFAFITNQESNKLDIIDLRKKEKVFEINVGKNPAGIFIDKKSKNIFISNPGSHNISKFNFRKKTQSFLEVGKSPMGVFLSNNNLLVSNWFQNEVSVFNLEKNKLKKKIKVGKSPAGILVVEENQELFVANKEDNNISVINLKDFKEIKKIKVGKAPYGIFSEPESDYVFVTNVQSNSISIIDKVNLSVVDEIKVGNWPYQIAINKKNDKIYVTNQRDNSITIIDVIKKKVLETLVDVCEYPEGIDISYNENLIVVACWFEDNIILLDLYNNNFVKKISVSGGPRSFGKFILD